MTYAKRKCSNNRLLLMTFFRPTNCCSVLGYCQQLSGSASSGCAKFHCQLNHSSQANLFVYFVYLCIFSVPSIVKCLNIFCSSLFCNQLLPSICPHFPLFFLRHSFSSFCFPLSLLFIFFCSCFFFLPTHNSIVSNSCILI